MNLSKVIFFIQRFVLLATLYLISMPTADSQDLEYSGYQLQSPFVNEFKASPDGKHLLYNVVTHNSISHKSKFLVQDMDNGGDDIDLGITDAHIHSWMDNEHVVLASETEFIIQNIYTKEKETFANPAPAHYEPLMISKALAIFSHLEINTTTYHFYKNGILTDSKVINKGFAHTVYDVQTNSILEVSQDDAEVNVYQYSIAKDQRNKLATIPFGPNRVIQDVTLKDGEIYYLEDYQKWDELDRHIWEESLMKLSSFNLSTQSKRIIYSFNKGVECLNMEVMSRDKYLLLSKDHTEQNDAVALKDMENNTNGAKELSASTFAKITDQFKGSISAKTMIEAIKSLDGDYPSAYINGGAVSVALSSLDNETKNIIKTKVEKLVISNGNVTVKLKPGVSYITLTTTTQKGNKVSVKINQGTTLNLTEVSSDNVYAKLKGISIWMAVKYASIGAISIKGQENTLSVFTSVGIGFWTSHKLGSVTRRVE
jgi:hypothetical protein